MPTNRLTNADFSAGSSSWTTDSPEADGTRVYNFVNGKFSSSGEGSGSISQLISVTAGETLFLSMRGFAFVDTAAANHRIQWGIYIPASGEWRCISDTENVAPRSQYWPTATEGLVSRSIPGWLGGEVTIPAGVTQVRVAVVLPPGVSFLNELNCYTSPNLVTDGDFSTNTDGTTGGDGATPEGWTLDWELIQGPGSGWTTAGGALKHTGASKSGAASAAFAVTAGELLYVEARAVEGTASIKLAYSDQANFTAAQRDDEHSIVESRLLYNREIKFGRFVTVPAGMTYARVVVYSMAGSGSCYFLSARVRRLSTMTAPSVRMDVSFGAASVWEATGQDYWVVGASDDTNDVGTSFMSAWPETYSTPWGAPFTNVSGYLRSIDSMSRGRNSKQDEFETGTMTFTLDNNDRRFDPLLTTGPYYIGGKAYMGVGYAVRFSLEDGDTGEPVPMFSGRVTSWRPRFKPNQENKVEVTVAEYYPDLNASAPDFAYASYNSADFLDDWLGSNGLNWDTEWKSIDRGLVTVPALAHTLGTLLPRARAAARTENGRFYLDPEGKPTFRIDAVPRMTESNASFDPSDITNPDRLDYEDASIEYDNDLVRNFVTATREGGVVADDQQYAEHAESVAEVGRVEHAVPEPGLLFQTNAEVLAWCEDFVADFGEPGPRVSGVDLWPLVNPMLWGLVMWAQYGDRFTMVVEPPPVGSAAVTQDVQYEGISSLTSRNDAEDGLRVSWTYVPATT